MLYRVVPGGEGVDAVVVDEVESVPRAESPVGGGAGGPGGTLRALGPGPVHHVSNEVPPGAVVTHVVPSEESRETEREITTDLATRGSVSWLA